MKKYIITIAILVVAGVGVWIMNMHRTAQQTKVVDINQIENVQLELTHEVSSSGNFVMSGDVDLNIFERVRTVEGHLVDDTLYLWVLQTGRGFISAIRGLEESELNHPISNMDFGDEVHDIANFYLISGPDMILENGMVDPSRYSEKIEVTLANR